MSTGHGFAGAFNVLLERYPVLRNWLQQKIKERAVFLRQISTEPVLKTRLIGLTKLHGAFLQQCRKAGITATDYPFNADRAGIAALSSFVKLTLLAHFPNATRAAGAYHLKGLPNSLIDFLHNRSERASVEVGRTTATGMYSST